jgi:hypothetical protein
MTMFHSRIYIKVFFHDICFVKILSMAVLLASVPQKQNLKFAELWSTSLWKWEQKKSFVSMLAKMVKKNCTLFHM